MASLRQWLPPEEVFDGALCAQTDPEAFHPERGESASPAKRVCMVCPARARCLEWALQTGQRDGIWGGLSPIERRRINVQRRKVAA
jgi:WhiB family redox-sensing transcriptional regulator